MPRPSIWLTSLALALLSMSITGCVSGPMTIHATNRLPEPTLCSNDGCTPGVQVVQGTPNKLIDGVGWVFGVPRKLLLWNVRVDNHAVQPETLAEVATYAEVNQLEDVCIRGNQYAPLDEWRRLTNNDRISPGWRYTMGTLSLVGYTLLPGRVFGGDNYNPYTNSVYIYSDIPALAMEAAAYAKDVQSRTYPGTYAAVNHLPVLSLWHETINTQDTLQYLAVHGTYDEQKAALTILYPNYGASVGGAFGNFIGPTAAFEIGGAIVGHISGLHKATLVDPQPETVWLENFSRGEEQSIRLSDDPGSRLASRLVSVRQTW